MSNTTAVAKCKCSSVGDALLVLIALPLMVVPWIMGLVIAKGFWSTLCAIFPPWAWYLTCERAMTVLLGPAWL